jgi:hypothetical protein
MVITNAHLHWFKLKCPYLQGSKAFRMAKAKLDNATYADLERLRAEFEMYKDGSIPVTHYNLYDEWFASAGGVKNGTGQHEGYSTSRYEVQSTKAHQWSATTVDI